jgi:putative MATE family efflux protein
MSNGVAAKKTLVSARTVDMTEGNILAHILKFALPLLLGNLFQQLYNMVDTWVIGQFGSNEAYAAVGNTGPVINILIGFYSGFATGAGVLIARHFGRKEAENVKKDVHTIVTVTLIMCVVFTVLGVLLAPLAVNVLFGEDSPVAPDARLYLTVYFAGISGLLLYNVGAGILRAVGDSRRPFYYLVVAAITNVVLDLLLVAVFRMGVIGVALATVISQAVSAVFVFITLIKSDSVVKVDPRALKIDGRALREILLLGLPAAIQMSLTALANVFVQGYISGADGNQTYNLGGFTTYSKIDMILFLPVQSLSLAVSTFVGQNSGVGDRKRARRGTYLALVSSLIMSGLLIVVIMLFAPALSSIFNPDENVIAVSAELLRFITPFYIMCSFNQVLAASLRGEGNTTAPMVAMLTCFVGIRQLYHFLITKFVSNALIPIVVSYPVGWISCAIFTTIYHTLWKPKEYRSKAKQRSL